LEAPGITVAALLHWKNDKLLTTLTKVNTDASNLIIKPVVAMENFD